MTRTDRDLLQCAATLAGKPYLTIAEAAGVAGLSVKAMKRWLDVRAKHEQGLLVHFTPEGKVVRKWWVGRDALARVLGVQNVEIAQRVERQGRRIDALEKRVDVLEKRRTPSPVIAHEQHQ